MFELFPAYKDCPEEFEPLWEVCVTYMGNACRRYRNMAEKKQQQPKWRAATVTLVTIYQYKSMHIPFVEFDFYVCCLLDTYLSLCMESTNA